MSNRSYHIRQTKKLSNDIKTKCNKCTNKLGSKWYGGVTSMKFEGNERGLSDRFLILELKMFGWDFEF